MLCSVATRDNLDASLAFEGSKSITSFGCRKLFLDFGTEVADYDVTEIGIDAAFQSIANGSFHLITITENSLDTHCGLLRVFNLLRSDVERRQ